MDGITLRQEIVVALGMLPNDGATVEELATRLKLDPKDLGNTADLWDALSDGVNEGFVDHLTFASAPPRFRLTEEGIKLYQEWYGDIKHSR
jgi:hypothetical protein